MGLADWSRGKITLVMLAVAAPVMAVMVMSKYSEERAAAPTGDCAHVDQAMRHWGQVLSDIQLGMSSKVDTAKLSRDTADAADAVRREAASITDSSMQNQVISLATHLEQVSRGNPSSAPNGFPDKNYMGGYQGTMTDIHDLKVACPAAANDPVPADIARPT